jgi:hypothetical protein
VSWRPNRPNVWNETAWPLPEITGKNELPFADWVPSLPTDTRRFLPVYMSCTTTSRVPPLRSRTRLVANVVKAT